MASYTAFLQILDSPNIRDEFTLGEGTTEHSFEYSDILEGGTNPVYIPILEGFESLKKLKETLSLLEEGVVLSEDEEIEALQSLEALNIEKNYPSSGYSLK